MSSSSEKSDLSKIAIIDNKRNGRIMSKARNTDSKIPNGDPLKIRSLMLDLDEYLQIFILPQIPSEYKDYREMIQGAMNSGWHEMYRALLTQKRERQKHILATKIEMAMVEVYLREIRDVCYRGKAGKKLDQNARKRFEIVANKHREVMNIIWAWAKNEDRKMSTDNIEKLAGLVEKEPV
ncbi:MAG: hypothetical protein Q4B87_00790 [Candidatus Saccharibacteria bacterium]|nr:hypothetical protein [Candidatus Saccharibacteria bacterium]